MYEEIWRRHRRARNFFWAVFIGYLPLFVALAWFLRGRVEKQLFSRVILVAWLGYVLFIVGSWASYASFKCPRCGSSFFVPPKERRGGVGSNFLWVFRRDCATCYLRKYGDTTSAGT